MADIQNQTLAHLPTKQNSKWILMFDKDNWNMPINKLFGNKEIERRRFISLDGENTSWFECSPALGNLIDKQVIEHINDFDNDQPKFNIEIIKLDGKYSVSIIQKPVLEINLWAKLKNRIKSFLKKEV
jgi:hypothetical protein